jgi:hypothetical protein
MQSTVKRAAPPPGMRRDRSRLYGFIHAVGPAMRFLCSPSPGQGATAIKGPHDPIGADEAQDGAATQRLEGRLPGRQGKSVR